MAYSEITWPVSLPQRALKDGYSEQLANNIIVTEMETGPARQRKRSSAGTETYTVSYILNKNQRDTLKRFLTATEGNSFWWPDASHETERYVRVSGASEGPSFSTDVGLMWKITLTLDIWPYVSRNK